MLRCLGQKDDAVDHANRPIPLFATWYESTLANPAETLVVEDDNQLEASGLS